MNAKTIKAIADEAFGHVNRGYDLFVKVLEDTTTKFDPVLHYSIMGSMCEFEAAINRIALSCSLICKARDDDEKKKPEQTEMPLASPSEPQRDKAQDVPVVKGEP